ncbi:MAG: MlaA family lipoprotein [Gammaproteobacteria bacterium]|nr:MlaA family lipoprotein [Gammaproteobacteria bacterium]MDH3560769.1 MlaA family lipoprotein [Gammaproteobacteria bacterium]
MPALGPSNIRDCIGLLVDSYIDLTGYAWENQDYCEVKILDVINDLSIDKDTYEGIKKDALDTCLFIRDACMQYRHHKVEN